jgi:NADH-quinone oxidoreductase subunit M
MVTAFAGLIVTVAVINILYGACITMIQKDMKRLIAYSSVSHMGIVILGIAAMNEVGLTGATLQMFTHGTITAMLFMMVGLVYDKAHTRQISELGGLARQLPFITIMMMIAGLASLGLPSMSGFVAEITTFLGTFQVWPVAAILAAFGVVLAAGYILWMMQRAFFGPRKPQFDGLRDATILEGFAPVAVLVLIFAVGVYPAVLTEIIEIAVTRGL